MNDNDKLSEKIQNIRNGNTVKVIVAVASGLGIIAAAFMAYYKVDGWGFFLLCSIIMAYYVV